MDALLIIRIVIILAIIELILKGMALWKAGNNRQLGWFIALFILNTGGLLPAIYLKFFQKKRQQPQEKKKKSKK